jgi:NADPH-dependent 2,4-dienoyl-CoA reductase/sulfur reductase-like enzyme/Fe-S-cluster-containing hydrogenase component 2
MPRRLTFDRDRCLACRSCELACAVAHSQSGVLAEALAEQPLPRRRVTIAQAPQRGSAGDRIAGPHGLAALRCSQCDEPLCVFSCKSGALHRLPDGGAVLDEARCIGCLMCFMVCPFLTTGSRREAEGGRREAEGGRRQGPEGPSDSRTVGAPDLHSEYPVRCDVCAEREAPACVEACPTRALKAVAAVGAARSGRTEFAGRLVVVGSSAAGIAACEAAREAAPACRITVVTADVQNYSRPLLPYALAGRIERRALPWRDHGYLENNLQVDVIDRRRATRLAAEEKTIWLDDGRAVPFDALVIATGARPATMRITGCDLPGVFGLRDLEDLDDLDRLARTSRQAVVIGGGNVGLQVSEALLHRGLQVTIVARSAHLLSQMVDEQAGRRVGELFARHGARLRIGRDVAEIAGDGRVERVVLDDGEHLEADIVVVGKGIQPNIEWLAGSGVRTARGIVVDAAGCTNIEHVFAAGDCAEVQDHVTGRSTVSGIWPVAYEAGRTAGMAAVGVACTSPGLRMNASRFFEVSIISIGEVQAARVAGATEQVVACRADVYRKLVFRGDRLIGAVLFRDVSGAGLYYRLYREALDLGGASADELERCRVQWVAALAGEREWQERRLKA